MNNKLSNIKNVAWAAAIGLCLLAVLIALGFAAFTRHRGELERPTVQLGEVKAENAGADLIQTAEEQPAPEEGDGSLRTLAETDDGGQSYIDSLTFLCDSALVGLRDYGLLTGGTATNQVWGSSAGNIPASKLASFTIRYPGDGSEISPADAAMIAKPKRLVICLGSDGLLDTNRERFIADYETLIYGIRQSSPDTVIIVSSITSVTISYSGSDGLDIISVSDANDWIRQICMDTGVYFTDAASAVRDSNGSLLNDYASANGKTLNSAGLNKVLEYLRIHVI